MGLIIETGGGGARSEFVVSGSPFSGASRTAAETARDNWSATSQSNRNELYNQDADPFRVAICVLAYGTTTETQQWGGVNQPANAAAYSPSSWIQNEGLDASEVSSLALTGVTAGQIVMKDATTGQAVNSGMQRLPDGTLLAPSNFGVESATILFGDLTAVSEGNSKLYIANNQFTSPLFEIIDARLRANVGSFPARTLHATAGATDITTQGVFTNQLSSFPLNFNITASLTAIIRKFKIKVHTEMVNVRLCVTYATGNQIATKYIPSKAAWLSGEGGLTLAAGDRDIDFGNSPFVQFLSDQFNIEVRCDSGVLLGDASNFPYLVPNLHPAEYRDLTAVRDFQSGSVVKITKTQSADQTDNNIKFDTDYYLAPVESITTNSPPPTPATDIRYIVGTNPSGVWASNTNKIATYSGSAWVFQDPVDGDVVSVKDQDNTHAHWSGSAWVTDGNVGNTIDDIRLNVFEGFETEWLTNNSITISQGRCGTEDGKHILTIANTVTATFDTSSIDNGVESASTWYYVWLYRRASDGVAVVGFSSDGDNPQLPSGHTKGRVVGVVYNNSTGNLRPFVCTGHGKGGRQYVWLNERLALANATITNRTSVDLSDDVPIINGNRCTAVVVVEYGGGAGLQFFHADETSTFCFGPMWAGIVTLPFVRLNSSGKFHMDSNGTNTGIYLKVQGFFLGLGV